MLRTIKELVNTTESGWPSVQEWIAESQTRIEVLPRPKDYETPLLELQVTTRSIMGAITYESGGLWVDHGWLAILGGGHERMPWTIAQVSRDLGWWPDASKPPIRLAVGIDVMGGV